MRSDPIASKSPGDENSPNFYLSLSLPALLCTGKIVKIYVFIYLCCSLVGRWVASSGNPHWRKKIEIGGKKSRERLRDIFKIKEKEGTENLSTSRSQFFYKQLFIGSSINSYRYLFCLRLPADNSQPSSDYLVTFYDR